MIGRWTEVPLGRWTEEALRLKPRGTGAWDGLKGRAYSYIIVAPLRGQDGWKWVMATARRARLGGWIGRIEGFEWTITSDMGAARFQGIPTTPAPLTHTPAKLFPTIKAAKTEMEKILADRPGQG